MIVDLICLKCKHFRALSGGCDAFGDNIPEEITEGENEHKTPLEGQKNNIVFEPFKNEDEQLK